jgi:hypothetical protein
MRKMQLGVTGRNQCQLSSSNYKLVVKARNMNLWLELDNCIASVAQLLRALYWGRRFHSRDLKLLFTHLLEILSIYV